jgi:hypothetical protein
MLKSAYPSLDENPFSILKDQNFTRLLAIDDL